MGHWEILTKTSTRPFVRTRAATTETRRSAPPTAESILEVLSKSGVLFFRFDPAVGVTFLTSNVTGFLGYTQEELMGDPNIAERMVDPEFLPRLVQMGAGFFVISREAVRVSIPFIGRSGERVVLETRVVPEISESGAISGFLGIAIDASNQGPIAPEALRPTRVQPL